MTIYLLYMASPGLLFVLLELFSGRKISRDERLRTTYFTLFAIIMILMIGLRHPSNGSDDTMFYCLQWESLGRVSFERLWYYIKDADMEVGYLITVWLLSHVFQNGQWLLVLSGLFFAVSLCRFAKQNCANAVLALTVFNCLGLFNFMVQGLRQSIAMCICLWSIESCKKRKPVRFLMLVALASLFHASAVLFAFMYVLTGFKLDVRFMLLFVVGLALIIVQLPVLFEIINALMNDYYAVGLVNEQGGWITILISFTIILFGMVFKNKSDPNYPLYIYMAIIGFECMFLRQTANGIMERVSKYYTFAEMVVVANSIGTIRSKRMQFVVTVIVFCLCFLVAVHKASYSTLIPYRFFWNT